MKSADLERSLKFSLYFATPFSGLLTLIVTLWDWLENPGGIFRNAEGTNWPFVADTALSWLVPGFLYLAVIGLCGHLLLTWLRRPASNELGSKTTRHAAGHSRRHG